MRASREWCVSDVITTCLIAKPSAEVLEGRSRRDPRYTIKSMPLSTFFFICLLAILIGRMPIEVEIVMISFSK